MRTASYSGLVNSGVTERKFTTFQTDVDGSSPLQKRLSALRYCNPFRNVSAINELGVDQFHRIGSKLVIISSVDLRRSGRLSVSTNPTSYTTVLHRLANKITCLQLVQKDITICM